MGDSVMLQSVKNQAAHMLLGFAGALFVLGIPWPAPWVTMGLVGLVIGLCREITQMQATGDATFGSARAIDVAFWIGGGVIAGLL